jgi:hypothetical protein
MYSMFVTIYRCNCNRTYVIKKKSRLESIFAKNFPLEKEMKLLRFSLREGDEVAKIFP